MESDVEFTAATRKFEFSSTEVKTFMLRVTGILSLNGVEVDRVYTTFDITVIEAVPVVEDSTEDSADSEES